MPPVNEFLLQQEFPSADAAVKRARLSLEGLTNDDDECACPHLRKLLPNSLDLKFYCRHNNHAHWLLQDPVQALHLQSQLDGSIQQSVLYGEEQERSMALRTEGFSEIWHPWIEKCHDLPVKLPETSAASITSVGSVAAPVGRVPPSSAAEAATKPPPTVSSSVPKLAAATNVPVASAPKSDGPVVTSTTATTAAAVTTSADKIASSTAPAVPPASSTSSSTKPTAASTTATAPTAPTAPLSDTQFKDLLALESPKFKALYAAEEQIKQVQRAFLSKRAAPATPRKKNDKKRSKTDETPFRSKLALQHMAAWKNQRPTTMSMEEELWWKQRQVMAVQKVELWMENYRLNRMSYWIEQKREKEQRQQHRNRSTTISQFQSKLSPATVFGGFEEEDEKATRCCHLCQNNNNDDNADWNFGQKDCDEKLQGDDLLQCLECSFIGCAPSSCSSKSKKHILQHFLTSKHKLAVSCGRKAWIYCFQCADYVSHEIFEQEKERLDVIEKMPWQGWREHPVQRSFDAFQFFHVPDQGIFWKGMKATFPVLVPPEHLQAVRKCRQRQIMFQGELDELPAGSSKEAIQFTEFQKRKAPVDRCRISAPVGMYNLGNTCFMSAILQCLINCAPLQRYFLRDVGHSHEACAIYRKMEDDPASSTTALSLSSGIVLPKKKHKSVCLACELDLLFVRYFSSTVGFDIASATSSKARQGTQSPEVRPMNSSENKAVIVKGDPLITSDMLTAAWKCGGMNHLAGYEQRDAHEFLHGFLEALGKHTELYRKRMNKAINAARPENTFLSSDDTKLQQDEIKRLFQGKLRSVLVCRDCGSKRIQSESFMSISLPLSKEIQMASASSTAGQPVAKGKLSVELCLQHFTMPELLADPVDCPSCLKKTPTKKQHVVSKLPKVLCLHLKRFDAAQNKKIEDFVSFPSAGLNMAPFLPHWCEVSKVPSEDAGTVDDAYTPEVLYDLFGTVNHFGNMQSGHYVSNLKVNNKWYHCNDSHVRFADEAEVLASEGAYVLFYLRR